MGTSRSPAELAGKFAVMSRELRVAAVKGVTAGTVLMASSVRTELSAATHGSNRLRGVGKNGAKLGARYDVKGSAADPVGLVQATGPWQFIEGDTKAHPILPKGVGRAQGRSKAARHAAKQQLYNALFGGTGFAGAKPLSMPWGPRFRALHPGTKGKHPWAKGVKRAEPLVLPTVGRETHAAMVRAFR